MKKLLADFLQIKEEEIQSHRFYQNYDLDYSSDGYGSSKYIKGDLYQPGYLVTTIADWTHYVELEELLVFIYNKK